MIYELFEAISFPGKMKEREIAGIRKLVIKAFGFS